MTRIDIGREHGVEINDGSVQTIESHLYEPDIITVSGEITEVHIDTWTGPIAVYIDGKRVNSLKKPKRFVLPMPDGTAKETSTAMHVAIREDYGSWHGSKDRYDITDPNDVCYFAVTQADIDAAPDWVKAIKKVEVID
ncbi:hypothetical protein [Lacticaseibacillus absianus]|uniref:hypothetical protein n=1 Tax=Lacticaseibacillus absianus TaxID=2729623 RepID=UPI0015CEC03A|nr:hypothetical protein [Lacticaseibacillus absianus]